MKNIYSTIIILLFAMSYSSYGQNQLSDPCEVYKQALKSRNLESINSILADGNLNVDDNDRLKLLKAKVIAQIYASEIRDSVPEYLSLVDASLKDIEYIIAKRGEVGKDVSDFQIKRYLMFSSLISYPQIEKDKVLAEKYYEKSEKNGVGLNLSALYNGETWVGGELALFQAQRSKMKQKNAKGEIIYKKNYHVGLSGLSFGYYQNVADTKQGMIVFNLLSAKAPISFQPSQICLLRTGGNNFFGYMPSIGYGKYGFNLSYNYLVLFKKNIELENRHFVKLEWSYVFNRNKMK